MASTAIAMLSRPAKVSHSRVGVEVQGCAGHVPDAEHEHGIGVAIRSPLVCTPAMKGRCVQQRLKLGERVGGGVREFRCLLGVLAHHLLTAR